MSASKYAELEFLRKVTCNNQRISGYEQGIQPREEGLAWQRAPLSEAQAKQFLAEEFEVLHKQYTKVRSSIKTLNKKIGETGQITRDILPEKISVESLIKFGQGR